MDKIGAAGTNQVTEQYTFDPQTGLLTNQKAIKNTSTTLLDLSYEYNRLGSAGSLNGKTGHLTKIVDNLNNNNKNREYVFDAVGRLKESWGGPNKSFSVQAYSYDRYGNRTSVYVNGIAADGNLMPRDGIANLAYKAFDLLQSAKCRRAISDGANGREKSLPGGGDPREVLKTIRDKKNIVHDRKMGGLGAGGRGEDPTGYIRISTTTLRNPNTYVLDPKRTRPNLTNQDARALIVLHELRHVVIDSGHTDATNSDEVYNDRILKDCFGK